MKDLVCVDSIKYYNLILGHMSLIKICNNESIWVSNFTKKTLGI